MAIKLDYVYFIKVVVVGVMWFRCRSPYTMQVVGHQRPEAAAFLPPYSSASLNTSRGQWSAPRQRRSPSQQLISTNQPREHEPRNTNRPLPLREEPNTFTACNDTVTRITFFLFPWHVPEESHVAYTVLVLCETSSCSVSESVKYT